MRNSLLLGCFLLLVAGFGGKGSTTGTFSGKGALPPQPLAFAPGF
jgi:hypothetical protein